MAHMNQENKAKLAAGLKKVMPEGWKYSLAVRRHSTIVLTIKSAPVDLLAKANEARQEEYHATDYTTINHYHIARAFKDESLVETFTKIVAALNEGNHDRSDSMSDYFDVGWYVEINIGAWHRPFTVTQAKEAA